MQLQVQLFSYLSTLCTPLHLFHSYFDSYNYTLLTKNTGKMLQHQLILTNNQKLNLPQLATTIKCCFHINAQIIII